MFKKIIANTILNTPEIHVATMQIFNIINSLPVLITKFENVKVNY